MVDITMRQMMRAEQARRRALADAAEATPSSSASTGNAATASVCTGDVTTGSPPAHKKRKTDTDNDTSIAVCEGDFRDYSVGSAGTGVAGDTGGDTDMQPTKTLPDVAVGTAVGTAVTAVGGSSALLGLSSYSDDEGDDSGQAASGTTAAAAAERIGGATNVSSTLDPTPADGAWAEAIESQEIGATVVESFEVIEPSQELLNATTSRIVKSNRPSDAMQAEGQHEASSAARHVNDVCMVTDTTGTDNNSGHIDVELDGDNDVVDDTELDVLDIQHYDRSQTAYSSALAFQQLKMKRLEEQKLRAEEVAQRQSEAAGDLPVGFFDDPDKDAEARGHIAPSKLAEEQMERELIELQTTVEVDDAVETSARHREDALKSAFEFEAEFKLQRALEDKLSHLRSLTGFSTLNSRASAAGGGVVKVEEKGVGSGSEGQKFRHRVGSSAKKEVKSETVKDEAIGGDATTAGERGGLGLPPREDGDLNSSSSSSSEDDADEDDVDSAFHVDWRCKKVKL